MSVFYALGSMYVLATAAADKDVWSTGSPNSKWKSSWSSLFGDFDYFEFVDSSVFSVFVSVLSFQQMQLLTKSQNENRDDHVELANVDFTFLLIFLLSTFITKWYTLEYFDICISVYALLLLRCVYLQQMQQKKMSDQQAEQEDHGKGGDFYDLIEF